MEVDYPRALELALAKRDQVEFWREAEIPIVFRCPMGISA